MRALVFTRPGEATVHDVPEPVPAPGEVLLRPRFVGLCGTDLELLSGYMPYFAAGLASYPIRPGHEISAIVAADGPRWNAGAEVVVDPVIGCGTCAACGKQLPTRCVEREEVGVRLGRAGGAAELLSVPHENVHALPAGVSLREAPLVEPGVTALNALRQLCPSSGQHALVIGAGTLGAIATQLLVSRGVAVDVLVLDPSRAALVERSGARLVTTVAEGAYDLVVEAAGTASAVHASLDAAAPGGGIAFTGIQARPVDGLDVNQVVLKDLTLHGVINGSGLYGAMLEELASGAVDASALIEDEFVLADAGVALTRLADSVRARPKVLLRL